MEIMESSLKVYSRDHQTFASIQQIVNQFVINCHQIDKYFVNLCNSIIVGLSKNSTQST